MKRILLLLFTFNSFLTSSAQTNRYFSYEEAVQLIPMIHGYNEALIGENNDKGIAASENQIEFLYVTDAQEKAIKLKAGLKELPNYHLYKEYTAEGFWMVMGLVKEQDMQFDSFNKWTTNACGIGFKYDARLVSWNVLDTAKSKQLDSFWNWFADNQKEYFKLSPKKPIKMKASLDTLQKKLDLLNPNFVFEFSPLIDKGKRELVLSVNGYKEAFGELIHLFIVSPELKKWDIVLFKQPSDVEPKMVLENAVNLKWNQVMFSYKKTTAGLGISFYIDGFKYDEEQKFGDALIILLDSYLGEYDAVMQLYSIDLNPLPEENKNTFHKFEDLRQVIEDFKVSKRPE